MKWITAHNLQEWSNSLAARTTFPGLIADLITASALNITEFRFPNREKGQVRGFDGVLEATGAQPFVPNGASIWEFGVSGDVLDKADDDFEKRTKDVDPAVRATTTFVFVTPRTWDRPSKQIPDWLSEKRALRQWKDVECFDGVSLEHWLDKHPAVASHYARYELGLAPSSGAYSSSEFWDEFSTRFAPPLMEDVLLAGREAQSAELLRRLAEGDGKLAYAADSADEVIAFVVAAIRRAPPETRAYLEARAMVIDSVDAARRLGTTKGLIYLPRGQARQFAGQLAQAGPTIISASADEQRGQHDVLARPSSSELATAFVSMGIAEPEGYELARRCGRSLAVLARQNPSGTAELPEWMKFSDALIPALLAGSWKPSSAADADVLKTLGGGATYEEVEAPLRGLTKLKDPPLDRVDDVWAMRSSVDAFLHLGHLIGGEHLARFADQAKVVFSQVIEPPKAEDVFRFPPSQSNSHSRWLREGMMTTLLHMAALHEKASFVVMGSSPQHFVDEIVRGLPNLSSDYRLLESLHDHLPLLAEAAPIPFFEALELLLEGDAAKLKPIFSERDDFFAPASAHTGVLWALELLSWNENYLLRSAICLAKLAAIDPGGKLSNRPLNSLRDVLLSWSPHTNASSKQRIGVLAHVARAVPSVAWPLLVKLLPQFHDSVSTTHKPKFAEASAGGRETLTYAVVWATQAAVAELAARHAGLSDDRWQTLIGAFSQWQPASFEHVAKALEDSLDKQRPEARFRTWDALRKEVNRHHSFSDAEWAMKGEQLLRLEVLVTKFQPEDPLLVTTWLFDDWMPDLKGNYSVDDPMVAIQAARTEALKVVMAAHGVKGLTELATRVKLPFQMAESLTQLALGEEETVSLAKQLLEVDGEAKSLAIHVVFQSLPAFGPEWVRQVHRMRAELHLSADDTARLFFALDDAKKTWEVVASFGTEVDDAYWQKKGAFGFVGTTEDMEYAIRRYCTCGRTLAAIEATHRRLQEVATATMISLLEAAIPEINGSAGHGGAMLEYYIEHIFEELGKRPNVAREDLARMEFAYLPFFHRRKKPLTLHKMLVESPEFFVSTICTIFKEATGEAPSLTEPERKLAAAAYELLNSLDILPGQVDGAVDFPTLQAWTDEVRQRAGQADRSAITDDRIGHLLAHSPLDPDDQAWPHKAVRHLVEQLSSDKVERAIRIERLNMRGVYSKAMGEGGQQERTLAEQAKDWAQTMPDFPRTANLLSSIAAMWFQQGEEADVRAAKDALRW
ncbi:hypothetical protein [Massilia mucilaginosa]|uniref:hypothetical protein n=1 Tax=Massilia mucilaginosa TaxID=2609282 RepID=UPI0016522E0B|nr:hypothetical protein [Massilia mucilaginosa]